MSTETAVKAKKRFKLTKNWIIMIVLAALIGLTVCSCATVQAVTRNPGAAVLDTYISAAKSQNVKKMASTFYKKGSDEYKAFVNDYNAGKKEYKSFSSSAGEQELTTYTGASENLISEPKDRGLRLYWESRIAKNIKGYDYTILVEDKDQVIMSVALDNKTTMATKDMPKKYSNYVSNGVSTKFVISFKRDPSTKKWYFAADFRFINGQRGVETWTAPYGDGKLEVKSVSINDKNINDEGELVLSNIAQGIVSIGTRAFEGCTSLKKLIIPNDLVNIGAFAFDGCKNLVEIIYADGTRINADSPVVLGEGAFYNCEKFGSTETPAEPAFVIPKINKTVPNYLFYNNKEFSGMSGAVALPEDISIIGHYAFYGCAAITSVNIPTTVTTIGDSAFEGCTKLATFAENNTVSDNVARLGSNAFKGCAAITSVILPDAFTHLATGVFDGCASLATVKLPAGIKSFGNYLFRGTAITAMEIPATVEKIGKFAFAESAIAQIDWLANDKNQTSIRTIGESAFSDCKALTKMTLPESIKGIGTGAFLGCTAMRSVMVDFYNTAVVGEYAFEMSDGIPKFYVKDDNLVGFRQKWFTMGLDLYSQRILTEDKMFAIVEETRKDGAGNNITEKVLVQYLGSEEMVTLDPTITRLGNGAFAHSAGLKGIKNFDDLKLNDIALNVFSGCAKMEYKSFGNREDLKYLGNWLIDGNNFGDRDLDLVAGLSDGGSNIALPNTVGIAAGAFSKVKTAIESVHISKGVKYISDSAFMQSNKLTTVTFEDNSELERLGREVFYSCGSLDSITLPSKLVEMGDRVFQYCDKLRYVVVNSDSNVVMGEDAFFINYGLPKVYINKLDGNDFYGEMIKTIAGSHNERSDESVRVWNAKVATIQSSMYDTKCIKGDYAEAMLSWTAADGTQHQANTLIQIMSTGLTRFEVPTGITRIGAASFAKSTIEEIEVHSGVTRVEEYAFYDCDSLMNVLFKANAGKDSLEYLGTHAFRDTKLIAENIVARVTFEADAPHERFTTGDNPFDIENVVRKVSVKVRAEYEKNEFWKTNRMLLDAEDDPWIEIEIGIKESGTNDAHTNIVSAITNKPIKNAPGEIQSITATEDEDNGYEFVGWYLDLAGNPVTTERTIKIEYNNGTTGNKYTALFSRKKAWVKVNIEDGLTSDTRAGGVIYRDEQHTTPVATGDKGGFLTGTNGAFTLYAKASPEFDFDGWYTVVGEVETPVGTNAKQEFSIDYENIQIVAKFTQMRAWAIISKPLGGTVTVTSTHDEGDIVESINDIRVLLEKDETVTIVAEADTAKFYEFNGWAVGSAQTLVSTIATESFDLDLNGAGIPQNKNINPLFEKIKVDVTVNFTTAHGSIKRTDNSLNSTVTSGTAMPIAHGTSVTFTAKAVDGYVFKCWKVGGVEKGTTESYSFTIEDDDPIVIVAEFEPKA